MNKSDKIDQLALALHKVQSEVKNPSFDSTNPHFKSKFASLVSVREAVMPVLSKHGLSVAQFPKAGDGSAGCVNLLLHHSGQWIEEECLLPLDKNNAQGAGSAITYARRYSLQAIAGVVADVDDDGNAASATVETAGAISATTGARGRVSPARRKVIEDTAVLVGDALREDRDFDAYGYCESFTDADEKVYLWSFLDSKQRSRLKAQAEVANRKVA